MSRASVPPSTPNEASREPVITHALERTRKQLRLEDVISTLLLFCIIMPLFALLVAFTDHFIPGGLGPLGRFIGCGLFLSILGWFLYAKIYPLIIYGIHPLYAACVIEKNAPSLKNALLNLLFLQREGPPPADTDELQKNVYISLERQTAHVLSNSLTESHLDHSAAVRLGYTLVAVTLIFCAYFLISPKNPFTSIFRVLCPWSNIPAPTRVFFKDIQPHHSSIISGDTFHVIADIRNLRPGEPVTLFYSTLDAQITQAAIPMQPIPGTLRYQGVITSSSPQRKGVTQNLKWHLVAADCTSPQFNLTVEPPLNIHVTRVLSTPPSYTGMPVTDSKNLADIKAVEGTRIKLYAHANRPIRQARLEWNASSRDILSMAPISLHHSTTHAQNSNNITQNTSSYVHDSHSLSSDASPTSPLNPSHSAHPTQPTSCYDAVVNFTLLCDPLDESKSMYDSYQVRFQDTLGRWSSMPAVHRIKTLPDLTPDIHIISAPEDMAAINEKSSFNIIFQARDPDFALRTVSFRAQFLKKNLNIPPLLDIPENRPGHAGIYRGHYTFNPKKWNLKQGDKIIWWLEAHDNRRPVPNITKTTPRILILAGENADLHSDLDTLLKNDSPNNPLWQPQRKDNLHDEANINPNDSSTQKPEKNDLAEKASSDDPGKNPADHNMPTESPNSAPHSSTAEQADANNRPDHDNSESENSTEHQNDSQNSDSQNSDSQNSDSQNSDSQNSDSQNSDSQNADDHPDAPPSEKPNNSDHSDEKNTQPQDNSTESDSQERSDHSSPGNDDSQDANHDEKSADLENSSPEPINPETDPGGAFLEILKDRNKSENSQNSQDPLNSPQPATSDPKNGPSHNADKNSAPDGTSESQPNPENARDGSANKKGTPAPPNSESSTNSPGHRPLSEHATPSEKSGNAPKEEGKFPNINPDSGNTRMESSSDSHDSEEASANESSHTQDERHSGSQNSMNGKNDSEKSSDSASSSQNTEKHGAKENTTSEAENTGTGSSKNDQTQGKNSNNSSAPSDQSGDRSGGEKNASSDQSNQQGIGRAGGNTAAGAGSVSSGAGNGPTAEKPGSSASSELPTGVPNPHGNSGNGSNSKSDSSGDIPGAKSDSSGNIRGSGHMPHVKNMPSRSPHDSEDPSQHNSNHPFSNSRDGETRQDEAGYGGKRSNHLASQENTHDKKMADDVNIEFARMQTLLALEHLRDQLEKNDSDILHHLGWTRQQALDFLNKWESLHKNSKLNNPQGKAAKSQLERALKNLGITPTHSELSSHNLSEKKHTIIRSSRRMPPPPEWADQLDAYTRGIAE